MCADTFWKNPQFSITLSPTDDGQACVVVSLMQESLRADTHFCIGFYIYKVLSVLL